jgi:PAS domain S-box-containing protein
MRRDDSGRQAGRGAGTAVPDRPGGSPVRPADPPPAPPSTNHPAIDQAPTAPPAASGAAEPTARAAGRTSGAELHRGVLTSGAADQLAALVARAAHAPSGLIHVVEQPRLRLYGTWGLVVPWADVADTPVAETLAGVVVDAGSPVVIGDIATDPRVPAGWPMRAHGVGGAYLGHPVRDENGAVLGVCCALDRQPREWTAEEITAVAEAAQVSTLLITEQLTRHEVDRQRRFLDAVLDSLHDGVTACAADGTIVLVNARMRKLWGHAAVPRDLDDVATVADMYDAGGDPLTRKDVALFRALHGEHLRDEEVALKGRTGRTRHYLVDAQPIIGPDGATLGAVQAVQDVTRRKRAERFRTCELAVTTALAEAPSMAAAGPRVLEAVVRTLDWAHAELWLVDDAGGVARSAAQWSVPGWDSAIEVPGQLPYGQGLAGRAWQAGKPLWIRDVGRPQSLISAETAASSSLHTALAIPIRHGLEPLGVLTMFTDSVEDPDDEIMALMSGIAAHIAEFMESRIVEDLQRQLNRSKNEYLALIGHELRTPLTSISAYTELLREADPATLAADGPAMLEVVDRNANQLRHIINELLELSALDNGQAAVQLTPIDLAQVVREAVDAIRAAISGEPLTLRWDVPDGLILPGDRRRLRQIVDNLVGNAVKYSPDGGTVTVRLRAVDRVAELAVSDSAVGVPAEEREKMFTGRYRTSRSRDKAVPGSGLGLTLSRAVVHRHHGTIELIDDGAGTTIKVRLPMDPR